MFRRRETSMFNWRKPKYANQNIVIAMLVGSVRVQMQAPMAKKLKLRRFNL